MFSLVPGVEVAYSRGLPQITVPLPSRREKCRFTLKPISNTVGDFIGQLHTEDRGIDRVVLRTLREWQHNRVVCFTMLVIA